MKHTVLIVSGLATMFVATLLIVDMRTVWAPYDGKMCTQEVNTCPDGSFVSRTGPKCEFTACPVVAATTTTSGGGSILPYKSGVQGVVLTGPTCPVERIPPDPACADKPLAVTIAVYHVGSQSAFVMGDSDVKGVFKFSIPPGSYTLQAISGKVFPRCTGVTVEVPVSGYVSTTISCDTGIR
jgi:hypothetical protein